MTDRKVLLAKLAVGDIFHAEYPNDAKCIGLVLSIDTDTILARRVTSQENLKFDRQTGVEKAPDGEPQAVINSVAPLPLEIHNVFVELDRKYGAVHGQKDIFEKNPEYFKLSEAEKKAFLFIDSHYSANLLPPLPTA
jgi:hypothetical protein